MTVRELAAALAALPEKQQDVQVVYCEDYGISIITHAVYCPESNFYKPFVELLGDTHVGLDPRRK